MSKSPSTMSSILDELKLLDKLEVIRIQGRDRLGRRIITIVGKFFPARTVSIEALKKYSEEKIFPKLGEKPWCMVYIHTGVQRGDNFPGISALRSVYDAIPLNLKHNLEALYFLHPGLHARLFFATFGRFLFSAGLYGKVKYVERVEFLLEHVRRKEMEIPQFVYEYDEQLEYRHVVNLGMERDHPRYYGSPFMQTSLTLYSVSCI